MLHGIEEGDPNAVHRTRVASRRLREVLPVLQLDPEVSEKLSRRLRKVTQRLGPVRELDVLLALIEELTQDGHHSHAALERVAAIVRAERDHARARFTQKRSVAELVRLAAKLEKLAHAIELDDLASPNRRGADQSRQWVLEARAAHRASALDQAMNAAGAVYQPDRLHAVRIAVKKLRYALEVPQMSRAPKTTPDLRLLKTVQDTLGRLHDIHVLVERVRHLQASAVPPERHGVAQLNALELSLENDCRRLHARYMREHDALSSLCAKLTKSQVSSSQGASQEPQGGRSTSQGEVG